MCNSFSNKLHEETGQSLIQVLITMGVMGIVMAGMMTLQNNQSRESKAAAERIARLDTARVLSMYFADPSLGLCTYEFATTRTLTFDDSNPPATATTAMPINMIHAGTTASSVELVTVGKAVSPISNTLIASSISLNNITGTFPNYSGNLVVTFNSNLTVRALGPLTIPIKIVATGVGNIKTITSCASVGPSLTSCGAGKYSTGYDSLGTLICSAPVYQ